MNEIPNIFRIGVKQFGAKATKGKVAKRAATEGEIAASVKESVGEALTRVSGNPDGRMRKAQQPAAAAHNQRWFPPGSTSRLGARVQPAKLAPPQPEPSVAEVAAAMRESLRADADAFRDAELLGKPGSEAAARRRAGVVKETPAPTPVRTQVANESVAKSAATGFVPAAGGGASGRSSAAVEVNRHEPSRTLGVSRVGAGAELKQDLGK
ncbi:hypothetical protein OG948_12430 [Embleya sp. NBC_00888]|uniref:hypothetical protein n=1 Tax=Embleya sp. NBC_00888 TaxID=2975960 RepID=UPI00386E6979|nr:hypothetical protein OG948_12430 [Embleya sp. NBC_00888]